MDCSTDNSKGNWKPQELEEIPCDYCGSEDARHVITRSDGLNVVECLRCGLAYINPRPLMEYFNRFYDKNYFLKADDDPKNNVGYEDYSSIVADWLKIGTSPELDIVENIRPIKDCQLLDVGCATGHLLFLAEKHGAKVIGVEVSDYAAQFARENFNLDIRIGPLESHKFSPEIFDIILALEVIEHVPSPTRFLKEISRILKPGGIVAISTPNYRCARSLKERWVGFQFAFEHLYYLSDEVLARMATCHCLEPLFWETTGTPIAFAEYEKLRPLRTSFKRIPGVMPLWNVLSRVFEKKPSLRKFKGHISGKDQWSRFGQGNRVLLVAQKK
jgi:2-polyprenyl-3-methyl-5-hydroxy-6-metoxy-1,4-benzoquinol methylase